MPAGKQASTLEELSERIIYSDRYSDDNFEYRHVILPKQMLKLIPKSYFAPDDSGLLRILEEGEWRGIGITQSLGWEHFEVHAPEPHICHCPLVPRKSNIEPLDTISAGPKGKGSRKIWDPEAQ